MPCASHPNRNFAFPALAVRVLGFQIIAGIGFALLATGLAAQQPSPPKVLAPHKPVPPAVAKPIPFPDPAVPRSMIGGLWMTNGNMKSAIYLKNSLVTAPLAVTPILYLANGTKIPLSPVTLEPAGTAIVSINDSLAANGIAPFATLSGYVEVQYSWPWDAICVTIRNIDLAHSLLFNYNLSVATPVTPRAQPMSTLSATPVNATTPAQPTARTIEGMWWKETPNTSGFLAISNPTGQPLDATVTVADNSARVLGTHAITVSSHGTKLVDLAELLDATANAGGLTVNYSGPEDGLLFAGGLQDTATGYSANIPLTEPAAAVPPSTPVPPDSSAPTAAQPTTIRIAELGLMAGAADPMMAFPAGTVFTPYSVIRNTSSQPIVVNPALYWMESGAARSAQGISFSVPPRQTLTLDVMSIIASAGLKSFNGSVNLILDVPAASLPSLLVATGSVDAKKNYVFGVLPTGVAESEAKSISYWSTGDGDDTMITVWNPADEDQDFLFTLFYSGGQYSLPMHLGPRATRTFNISQIIHNQIPDAEGNVIPIGIHEGTAQISGTQGVMERILVAMDAGTYNVAKATCGYYCLDCEGFPSGFITLNPFYVPLSGTTNENFIGQHHNGTQAYLTGMSSTKWSSSDTSKATVSTGVTTGVGMGSFNLNASYVGVIYNPHYCGRNVVYCPGNNQITGASPGTVKPTVAIQGNPTYVYIATDPTVIQVNAVFGQGTPGGGTYKWSSPDTYISFDNASAQDAHVEATNYTGGINDTKIALDYTYNGQSAAQASAMITKRIFKYLSGDSVIEVAAYTGPTQYGYEFQASYSVFANPGGVQVTNGSGISTWESLTPVSSNVSLTPNFGQGALNTNSQLLDTLALVSNSPLPPNLSIVDSQELAVGGIYVRTNTLTFTSSGVTVTNDGPYN